MGFYFSFKKTYHTLLYMISLIKRNITEIIYKINLNSTDCNYIDIIDLIKNTEDNYNTEINKLIQYIKYYFNKYIKYFDSYVFKSYDYDEILKVLETCILSIQSIEKLDNKIKYVV